MGRLRPLAVASAAAGIHMQASLLARVLSCSPERDECGPNSKRVTAAVMRYGYWQGGFFGGYEP